MEKLKSVPRNYVTGVNFERVADYYSMPGPSSLNNSLVNFNPYGETEPYMNYRMMAKIEITMEITSKEDEYFLHMLQRDGLQYVSDNGFPLEKFKFVINEGYKRLPVLMRHEDPEIQKIAWIISKYFSQREDIIPDKVVE